MCFLFELGPLFFLAHNGEGGVEFPQPETEIPCCKMKSLSVVNVVTADRSSGAHHICYSEIFFFCRSILGLPVLCSLC